MPCIEGFLEAAERRALRSLLMSQLCMRSKGQAYLRMRSIAQCLTHARVQTTRLAL